MNNFFKKIVAFKLRVAARVLLLRTKPEVIAITGSAGKTSAKEFMAHLLEIDFHVLAPSEGYNTEIGAPLSLFGEKVPVNLFSPLKWAVILVRVWIKAIFTGDLPDKVIIEMGADKPGDIPYLCRFFKPKTGVILSVLPVHLEEFKSVENIAAEKSKLAECLDEDDKLFLNYDDLRVREMAKKTKAEVIYFGRENKEGYAAQNLKSDLYGISFDLEHSGEIVEFKANIYGNHMIYPLISAISVAAEEGTSTKKIKETVAELTPFKGRMNVIEGENSSKIIDDSYNANPESTIRALEFLGGQNGKKIAALGTMNELGDFEEKGHQMVGEKAAQTADFIITVGEPAEKYLVPAAVGSGMSKDNIKSFKDSDEAGDWLAKNIEKGDIILVKGSQNNVRMEKVVKKIMAEPDKAKELLVRQSEFWQESS